MFVGCGNWFSELLLESRNITNWNTGFISWGECYDIEGLCDYHWSFSLLGWQNLIALFGIWLHHCVGGWEKFWIVFGNSNLEQFEIWLLIHSKKLWLLLCEEQLLRLEWDIVAPFVLLVFVILWLLCKSLEKDWNITWLRIFPPFLAILPLSKKHRLG